MESVPSGIQDILSNVYVNVPFSQLIRSHLELFLTQGINPEIGLDAESLDTFSLSVFRAAAERLKCRSLTVTFHGPFIDLSPGSRDFEIRGVTRRRFEQVLRLMPIFRPVSVVCHAGYEQKRYGFFREEWMDHSVEMWRWFAERVRDEGGRLMLENVYEDYPGDIREIFEALSDRGVGFCLDIGHQAVFSRAPLANWLGELGAFIGQIHLHDNHGNTDDHLALGRGGIDFAPLFSWLKIHRAKSPILTLEPHREADLWSSLTYLRNAWPLSA